MLKRFITWLIMKFLNIEEHLETVSTRLMHRGQDRFVMQKLYVVHERVTGNKQDYYSFNRLCMEHLMAQFKPEHFAALHLVSTLQNERGQSPDLLSTSNANVLANKIVDAVSTPNPLKRRTAVRDVLWKEMPALSSEDIELLAAAAINCNYNASTYATFLTTPKGNRP